MQYNNIYKFKIFYLDELGNRNHCNFYSDDSDIYSLKNLPDTAFYIDAYHLREKDYGSRQEYLGAYLIGTPVEFSELEKEIKLAENSSDNNYYNTLINAKCLITNSGAEFTLFRMQGKLLCLSKDSYPGKLVGAIQNGRITKENKTTFVKNEDGDNYIGLE